MVLNVKAMEVLVIAAADTAINGLDIHMVSVNRHDHNLFQIEPPLELIF